MKSRELHGVRWQDDLAWMEDMHGPKWEKFVKGKQEAWAKTVRGVGDLPLVLQKELEAAKKVGTAAMFQVGPEIQASQNGTLSYTWFWKSKPIQKFEAADLDFCKHFPGHIWTVEASPRGDESYTLQCYKEGQDKPIWQHSGVGPFVTIIGGRCYTLEARNSLVYYKLVSWNAKTGEEKKQHYEEHDSRYNLELLHGSCDVAVLRRQSGPKQDCIFISSVGLRVAPESISLLSRRFIFDRDHPLCYYVFERGQWGLSRDLYRKNMQLPKKGVPEGLILNLSLAITRWQGTRMIWRISQTSRPLLLWRGVANIVVDPWGGPWIRISQPGREVVWWNCTADERPHHAPCFAFDIETKRAGETHYVLIKPICDGGKRVKGLLITGYGAYGLPTPMSTARWQPLLHRGWAIAIPMFRGGGDHTPEWEDAGRCHGREQVLEDAEAVVRSAREATGVDAERTVLYGRSAGGLWVGGLVARDACRLPREQLFGGAYMEVPYLDVLRTTTNRTLPLTDLETNEFGLPEARLSDFASILHWSPMEIIQGGLYPRVWQIVRTGLNDREVFAYESAKWAVRSGPRIVLAVEDGQGHFVGGDVGLRQQAEDLAILLQKI